MLDSISTLDLIKILENRISQESTRIAVPDRFHSKQYLAYLHILDYLDKISASYQKIKTSF